MELTTKFNINDEVWFIHPNTQKAVLGRIQEINLKVGGKPKYRTGDRRDLIRTGEYTEQKFVNVYHIDDMVRKEGVTKREDEIFTSKEDLVSSIKKYADNL